MVGWIYNHNLWNFEIQLKNLDFISTTLPGVNAAFWKTLHLIHIKFAKRFLFMGVEIKPN